MRLSAHTRYQYSNFFFLFLSRPAARLMFLVALAGFAFGRRKAAVAMLLKSIRTYNTARAMRLLKRHLPELQDDFLGLSRQHVASEEAAVRSIILSLPQRDGDAIRKGVLLVTFTTTLAFYLRHPSFALLDKYFVFVLEPSWAGYSDPEILLFLLKAEHCLVQATEERDRILLNSLFPLGIAASFGASDWVNPSLFRPKPLPKKFDSVYVANLNPIKRAYRYIDAIDNIVKADPGYKGCLICAGWGGDVDDIKGYLASKNLSDNLVFIPGMERSALVDVINESKVNILLSFKEGSNRSLFESMFANVPVICISENIGVNKSYINEFTGLLISDAFLEEALVSMKANWSRYQPRRWAEANMSPAETTRKLSMLLEHKFGAACDARLAVKTNDPEVVYLDSDINSLEMNKALFETLAKGDEQSFWQHLSGLQLPPALA